MIGPEAMQGDGGAPAPVQRLRPINPKDVGPHDLKAMVYLLNRLGKSEAEITRVLICDLGLRFRPDRISADDPRTGDMVELGDNRAVYVNERIEISDPMTWKALCMNASPDAVYTLAGGR